MGYGRLIRVSRYRGDPNAVAYIVAVSGILGAREIVRRKIGVSGSDIHDLGHVSDAEIKALNLMPGDCVPANGSRAPSCA